MKSGDDVASEPLKRPWMVKRQMRWWIAAALVLAAGVVISQMIPARGGAADAQDGGRRAAMAQPGQHRRIRQGQLLPKHSVDIVAPTEGTLTSWTFPGATRWQRDSAWR